MDRIALLVAKLQELVEQKATPETLFEVTQQLQSELMQVRVAERLAEKKKIAVRMPSAASWSNDEVKAAPATNGHQANGYHSNGNNGYYPQTESEVSVTPEINDIQPVDPQPVSTAVSNGHHSPVSTFEPEATVPELKPLDEAPAVNGRNSFEETEPGLLLAKPEVDGNWLEHAEYNGSKLAVTTTRQRFDVLEEVPTLSHQPQAAKELNDVIGSETTSINDRLKEDRTELAEKLQGAPIRDLRKAINVNDRYRFITELFRGDEAMFERSLKTINHFSIFAEAQYWIQRELKLKLGWRDDQPAVVLFDQLVKEDSCKTI